MKILLVAVNAKYIHSNLAVYSLKAYAQNYLKSHTGNRTYGKDTYDTYDTYKEADMSIELAEYTINQPVDNILMDIYRRSPDVLCLSCYIWNLEYVEILVREMGKLKSDLPIWLGGPEVSYDAADVLTRLPALKGIMKGEGEETFAELCRIYRHGSVKDALHDIEKMPGITLRNADGAIQENPWRQVMNLNDLPFVYAAPDGSSPSEGTCRMEDFRHKIIYYESSRGCPFSCSYCLSSIDRRLRFRDLGLVKKELQFFIDQKAPQVKFVDRTFNCRHEHALSIWRYIEEHDRGITNFHFEVAADILNEEELGLLERMRPGLVQLEIGVQSTNPDTIHAIRRTMDFDRVRTVVSRIQKGANIHLHLDLIAGLPYEDIGSFARSFDDVYALKPEQLQLGFLKVLKGSYMEEKKEEYGLVYQSRPPYEVLYTRWISYEDLIRLKGIEEMVEIYYNSGQFRHTLEALERKYPSAFSMYDGFHGFYEAHGYDKIQHKRSARYEILLQYITERFPEETERFRELLTYDYYLRENARSRPDFAGEYKVPKEVLRTFYENEEAQRNHLPAYEDYDRNQMRKMTHLEYFAQSGKYILFDYKERNILNQDARICIVKL